MPVSSEFGKAIGIDSCPIYASELTQLYYPLLSFLCRLCKDPERKFCPSCGNPSLLRTSITYVTPSPENPKGYILHLKANFQYRLRGTQYSIPSPKPGSSNAAKNSKNSDLILREDQKEYQRGLRSADYLKKKQEKAAAKAIRDGKTGGTASVFSGWDDPDWSPEMLMGEKGRKGGLQGIRVGKDGLPIVSISCPVSNAP